MTNFKPILFSTPMVQAILEGRKTMTRRICEYPISENETHGWSITETGAEYSIKGKLSRPICRYGKIGTILWVRETFANSLNKGEFCYKSDTDNPIYLDKNWKWKPSLFMPKSACRIFLKITDIRVERLQDISEDDATKEGIELINHNCFKNYMQSKEWAYNNQNQNGFEMVEDPIGSFASLWSSINGEQSWNDNPWVWVISFEKIDKPTDFV